MKQYLDLLYNVLRHGDTRNDRTGVRTKSLFGLQLRFDLREGFPAVTTKKLQFKSVAQELAWFLRGETNVATLGNGIWNAWAGHDGDVGPVYGAQWRKWGATHRGRPRGVKAPIDQIASLVHGLSSQPHGRRHLVSAWNVADLPHMGLPPCHFAFQCYVGGESDEFLDLKFIMRSTDAALGLPFNQASYGLLLALLAKQLGKLPRYLLFSSGDCHVYWNHIPGVLEQMMRDPLPLPTLWLHPDATVDNFTPDMARLDNYEHHPAIRFEIAV